MLRCFRFFFFFSSRRRHTRSLCDWSSDVCSSDLEFFVGDQFREAIALYYQRTPGAVKRYPEKLEDLLEDKRYLSMQRYLRKIHADPMTGKSQWGMIAAPGGGIMGVHSLSDQRPIKSANFDTTDQSFAGGQRYSDWNFLYDPPARSAANQSR